MIKENEPDNPVLAICYDFDKTLSPDDMQAQGYIQSIDYEVDDFWRESNELSEKNEMDRNLAYMYLMAEKSRGKVLFTKETLHNDGAKVKLYPGVATPATADCWDARSRRSSARPLSRRFRKACWPSGLLPPTGFSPGADTPSTTASWPCTTTRGWRRSRACRPTE